MISIYFRQKRLPCRSVSDCPLLLNCLYRKQSEKYSAKWDRGFRCDCVRSNTLCRWYGAPVKQHFEMFTRPLL